MTVPSAAARIDVPVAAAISVPPWVFISPDNGWVEERVKTAEKKGTDYNGDKDFDTCIDISLGDCAVENFVSLCCYRSFCGCERWLNLWAYLADTWLNFVKHKFLPQLSFNYSLMWLSYAASTDSSICLLADEVMGWTTSCCFSSPSLFFHLV